MPLSSSSMSRTVPTAVPHRVRLVLVRVVLVVAALLHVCTRTRCRSSTTTTTLPAGNGSGGGGGNSPTTTMARPSTTLSTAAAAPAPESSWSDAIDTIVDRLPPRAFRRWNNGTIPLPCPPADEAGRREVGGNWAPKSLQSATGSRTGMLFVKVPKTGSSTGSSVTLRIASQVYEKSAGRHPTNNNLPRVCRNRVHHAMTHQMGYDQRDKKQSILWSMVRDPTSRLVSDYFFYHVSRGGNNASEPTTFPKYVQRNRRKWPSLQVRYLSFRNLDNDVDAGRGTTTTSNGTTTDNNDADADAAATIMIDTIRSILREYDFVGVSERMDESLVALQLLLGLNTSDILHLSSKLSGGYDAGESKKRCAYLQPSFRTPEMNEFLDGDRWRQWSQWDAVLHQAANRSLDMTIDQLGHENFRQQLDAYRTLQRHVNSACSRVELVPCDKSREGLPPRPSHETGCIWGDIGCGMACIDEALANLGRKGVEADSNGYIRGGVRQGT